MVVYLEDRWILLNVDSRSMLLGGAVLAKVFVEPSDGNSFRAEMCTMNLGRLTLCLLVLGITPGIIAVKTLAMETPGNYVAWHMNETRKEEQFQEDVIEMISQLEWKTVNMYTNSTLGRKMSVFLNAVTGGLVRITLTSELDEPHFRELSKKGRFGEIISYRNHLNIIICCADCVQHVYHLVIGEASPSFVRESLWLVVTDRADPGIILNAMDNVAVAVVRESSYCFSGVFTVTIQGDNREFRRIPGAGTCGKAGVVQHLGKPSLFPNSDTDLHGRTIRVGIAEWASYVIKSRAEINSSDVTYTGIAVDLIQVLKNELNFRIKYVEPTAGQVWDKLLEMLYKQEIDMILSPFILSVERQSRMDITYPIIFDTVSVYYRQQTREETWQLLLEVLTGPVIILTMAALLTTGFVAVICQHGVPRASCQKEQTFLSCGQYLKEFLRIVFSLWGHLLRQGQRAHLIQQIRFSARILFATWCVFSLVFAAAFTAQLVPLFGVIKQSIPFRNLRDLINNDKYTWGTLGGPNWIIQFLQASISQDHKDLYSHIVRFAKTDPNVLGETENDHFQKLDAENYAYISAASYMQHLYNSRCDIAIIRENLVTVSSGLPLTKKSPYTKLFSKKIAEFYENGLMGVILRKWLSKPRLCTVDRTSTTELNMGHLQSVFLVGLFGISVSVAVIFVEKLTFRYSCSSKTD